MKTFKKISAFLISASMLMSLAVMPASAEDLNRLTPGSFEGLEVGTVFAGSAAHTIKDENGKDFGFNTAGADSVTVVNSETEEIGTEAQDGENCLFVKRVKGNYGGARFVTVPLESKQAYRFSVWVKLADSCKDVTNAYMEAIGEIGGGGTTFRGSSVNLTPEWQEVSLEFASTKELNGNNVIHLGTQATSTATEIYLDNFRLEKIDSAPFNEQYTVAACTATAARIILTADNNIYGTKGVGFDKSFINQESFSVSGGGSVTTATKADNAKQVSIYLADLKPNTEYTITSNGVYDYFLNQPAAFTFKTLKADAVTADNVTVQYSSTKFAKDGGTAFLKDENGIYKFELPAGVSGEQAIRIQGIGLLANTSYYVEALVRDGNTENEVSPVFKSVHNGHSCFAVKATEGSTGMTAIGSEWTKISYVISFTDEDKCGTASHYKEGVLQPRMHLGFNFACADADILEAKDFKIYKLAGEYAVTATAAMASTSDVPLENAEVTYTFTNANLLPEITADSFALTGGAGSISKVEKVEDGVYKLTLTGLESKKTYKVSTVVKNVFNVPVTDTPVSFVTVWPENIFEGLGNIIYKTANNTTPEFNTGLPFVEAEGAWLYEKLSQYTQGARYINIQGTVEGADYYFEAKVRYANPAAEGVTRNATASANFEGNGGTDRTAYKAVSVTISDEYQTVWAAIKNTAQPAGKYHHIGIVTSSAEPVYIKDFVLKKLAPVAPITADIADGAVDVPVSFDIIYSSEEALTPLTANNFAVTGGSVEVTPVSEKAYKVTVSGLDKGVKYTITSKDVKDIYGRPVENTAVSFTTVKNILPVSNDLLEKMGVDGGFENWRAFSSVQKAAAERTTETAYAGEASAKIVATDKGAAQHTARWHNLTPGFTRDTVDYTKQYVISFYAKTAEGTNKISVHYSQATPAYNTWYPTGKTNLVSINADEWTKVTASMVVTKYPAATRESYAKTEGTKVKYAKYLGLLKANEATAEQAAAAVPDGNPDKNTEQAEIDKILATLDEATFASYNEQAEASYKSTYDKVVNETATYDAGFHFGVYLDAAGTVYIDELEIREVKALGEDDTYFANVTKAGNNLEMTFMKTGDASDVVVIATKRVDGKTTDVKYAKVTAVSATTDNPASVTLKDVDDSYEIYIWDGALKPLNKMATLAEI